MTLDGNDGNIAQLVTEILSQEGDIDIIIIKRNAAKEEEIETDLTYGTEWDALLESLFTLDVNSQGASGGGGIQQPALLLE